MNLRSELIAALYVLAVLAGIALNFFLFGVLYDMGGWLK